MIKEPYVKLKEVIIDNPSVANIDESSILAGVINAPCGPDYLLVQGPKQFLKEFTVGNAIPRDADVTLINAYFCSFFAPLLLKRAWKTNNGNVPILYYISASSQLSCDNTIDVGSLPATKTSLLYMKYPVDIVNPANSVDNILDKTVIGVSNLNNWNSKKVSTSTTVQDELPTHDDVIIIGDDGGCKLIYVNSAVSLLRVGDEISLDGTTWATITQIERNDPSSYTAVLDRSLGESGDTATSYQVRYAQGNLSDLFGAEFNFIEGIDATQEELDNLRVIYWYDYNTNTDPHEKYSLVGNGRSDCRLVSLTAGGINPLTGREIYYKDIMDDDTIKFGVGTLTSASTGEFNMFQTSSITADWYNKSSQVNQTDCSLAFSWFEENSDVYNISYVSAFGKSGYEGNIATDCQLENTRWFYFCDVPLGTENVASINSFCTGVTGDTYRTAVVGGWDKNTSVTGWVAPISPSSLIYQKLYSNKNSNSEFAPLFDMTNGTLNYIKPYKQFTKSDREKLLNNTYPTNWVKYDRTNNVYYMNDNRTHTRKQNVMNEEMNVRMINKIQRDVMLIVQKYKGMLNTVETRLDVVRLITDYMDRYIMSQNYRPVEYRLVCDATNNTPDIINANKLAIELDVRIQGSIKFIEILNKVFPLGVAFEE